MNDLLELALQHETHPRSVFKHLVRKNRVYGYYAQQDSHEAFINLLDIMENEIKSIKKYTRFEFDFQSYLVYRLNCFNCGMNDLLFQDNTNIMLDIERNTDSYPLLMDQITKSKLKNKNLIKDKFIKLNKETIRDHINVKASGFSKTHDELYEDISPLLNNDQKKQTKLEEMIDSFFDYNFYTRKKHEYKCEKCLNKSTSAYKKYYMFKPPKVLVLCVKKFAKSSFSLFGRWRKSTVNVTYPEYLDLTEHTLRTSADQDISCKYRLIGAVHHSGGLGGGHYTCYVRKNERWFYISDSYYKESNLNSALNADAYLVFYEKL
jgi:ubiquitin C-terminal hydrolase